MNDFTVNDSDRIKELEEEIESLKKAGNFVTGEDAKRFDDEMRKNETRQPLINKDMPVFKTEIEQERDELKADKSRSINETKARGIEDAIIYANNRVTEEGLEHGDKIEVKILNKYAEKLRSE